MTVILPLELSPGPYASTGAHLRDELARVDVLLRAQVVRWRATIAASKPAQLWGMIHVSDAEIDQYLGAPIAPPDRLGTDLEARLEPYWKAERDVATAIRTAVAATPAGVDLRVERLRKRFALSDPELDVVLLALLPELDLRYGRLFGYLRDDASQSTPRTDLLGQILHPKLPTLEEKREIFEPSSTLRRWEIIRVSDRDVRVDERIAAFLHGDDAVDARLNGIVTSLPASQSFDALFAPRESVAALRDLASHPGGAPDVVVMRGSPGSGRARAAAAVSAARGLRLLRFDVARAMSDPVQWSRIVMLAYREAMLAGAALYVDGVDRLERDDVPPWLFDSLAEAAEQVPLLTFLATELSADDARWPGQAAYLRVDFPPPHLETRVRIWRELLPASVPDGEAVANHLAAAFQLTEGQIRDAVAAAQAAARRRSASDPVVTSDDLHDACRKQAGRRLVGFARRIEPTRGLTIDDVIVTESNKRQLRELLDRVRLRPRLESEMRMSRIISHRKGLLVLFAGPSGTGKTLAAEVIANQQGVDLYKVDVSAVVSKWVGETEKNLSRIFADAEGSDALLFFDECDSLFGQRGEISDGRDRWANLQTNYLLQRVEDYGGVVILASNLRKNIDEAFLRRIEVIIEFQTPDAALRLQLWKRSIVSDAVGERELRDIAERFSLTGGGIRNAVIAASYRALAAQRESVTLRDLVDGVAREYQKVGRPITKGDFGDRFYEWALADVIIPPAPV